MEKHKQNLIEFLKFIVAGVVNTGIDFLILNALISLIGLGENNAHYTLFKGISFTAAVFNSYYLNKLWVFKGEASKTNPGEIMRFLSISTIGLLLNMFVSSIVFKIGPNLYDLNAHLWANIGAVFGTLIVFIWNFFGYKLFVFKKLLIPNRK
jgi:putative flippase GtrA